MMFTPNLTPALLLCMASMMLTGCINNGRGFKPAADASSHWKLNPEERKNFKLSEVDGFLNYINKKEKDFRSCGIDPVGGGSQGLPSEAQGYLCIESKGWYSTQGPICTQSLPYRFNDPVCVAWRKERGLENMQRPLTRGEKIVIENKCGCLCITTPFKLQMCVWALGGGGTA